MFKISIHLIFITKTIKSFLNLTVTNLIIKRKIVDRKEGILLKNNSPSDELSEGLLLEYQNLSK